MAAIRFLRRRGVALALLVVFAGLTVEAGFFHTCHGSKSQCPLTRAQDDQQRKNADPRSICMACLLTQFLSAAQPAYPAELVMVGGSENALLPTQLVTAVTLVFLVVARAPPAS